MHALGVNANTVTTAEVKQLSDAVRGHAIRLMGVEKANRLADAIARCEGAAPKPSGHKLATDAAQKLFDEGKLRLAEKAYLELVQKHGDAESYVGLGRTQIALDDPAAALNTLREGAAKFARQGDRATAISLLAEAAALVPEDLSAHRRLAAALANQGDMPGAVEEYARFVDVALRAGDSRRALLELAYGRETLGDLPGLTALVDRVTGAHSRIDAPQPAARKASLVHHLPAASSTPVPPPPTSTLRVERSREAPSTQPVAAPDPRLAILQMSAPRPGASAEPDPRLEALKAFARQAEASLAAKPAEPEVKARRQPQTVINAEPQPEPADPRLEALSLLSSQPIIAPEPIAPAPVAPQPVAPEQAAANAQAWVDVKMPPKLPPKPTKAEAKAEAKAAKAEAKAEARAAKAEAKAEIDVETKQESKPAPRTRPDASHTAVILNGARTMTHVDHTDLEAPVDVLARAGVVKRLAPKPVLAHLSIDQQLSALPPMASGIDGAAIAASRAALLTRARDARATDAALDAARRLLALGKLQSASDVLLDYIAHGFTDREAQRLLIEVDCALNRRDVAKEKCDLLSRAYRLDGRGDVAEDVERLAKIL